MEYYFALRPAVLCCPGLVVDRPADPTWAGTWTKITGTRTNVWQMGMMMEGDSQRSAAWKGFVLLLYSKCASTVPIQLSLGQASPAAIYPTEEVSLYISVCLEAAVSHCVSWLYRLCYLVSDNYMYPTYLLGLALELCAGWLIP